MFTGIVTDVGSVRAIEPLAEGRRLTIETAFDPNTIDIGASIACGGPCLTVVAKGDRDDRWFAVEAWEEAIRLTTLGDWGEGRRVNLERSLKIGDELGGHLVSGHVDGTATIRTVRDEGEAVRFVVEAPSSLSRFIAQKGSVALDGTSLTVNGVNDTTFDVLIIKHTLGVTTWGERGEGDRVNLEVDQMARYAARLLATAD